jgi:hypothetical protein
MDWSTVGLIAIVALFVLALVSILVGTSFWSRMLRRQARWTSPPVALRLPIPLPQHRTSPEVLKRTLSILTQEPRLFASRCTKVCTDSFSRGPYRC